MGLLEQAKDYLGITWEDSATDQRITGFLERGKARLCRIAGTELDFEAEDLPKALLLDYCRYANSQALEVFEINFTGELLDLREQYYGKEEGTDGEDQNTHSV